MKLRTAVVSSLAAVTALAIATGCSPASNSSNSSDSSDTLTVAAPSVAQQIDPSKWTGNADGFAMNVFLEQLVEYDTSKEGLLGPDDIRPLLAESWKKSDDGKTITLKLREGVESPFGNEMTADDVVWTYDRLVTEPSGLAAGVTLPAGRANQDLPMVKVDDYTVVYNLEGNSPLSLASLAERQMGIIDSTEAKKHATKDDPWAKEWLATNSASFGAYTVSSYNPGEEIRFAANPNYWGGAASFENIVIKAVPDGSARSQLLQAGQVDIIDVPPPDQWERLKSDSKVNLIQLPGTRRDNITFNTKDPQLANPDVRRALSMAINRDAIVKSVYNGQATPAVTPLASLLLSEQPELGYDPDAARELLDEATGSKQFEITLSYNIARPGPWAEDLARIVQQDWQAIGVKVNLNPIPTPATFQKSVADGSLQAWFYNDAAAFVNPAYALSIFLESTSSLNDSGYSNPKLDALIKAGLSTDLGPAFNELMEEATGLVSDDVPVAAVAELPDTIAAGKDIVGLRIQPNSVWAFDEIARK